MSITTTYNMFQKFFMKIKIMEIEEPFQEIPRHKWPQILDIFKRDWPDYVVAYCILDTQISKPNLSIPFKFKIYSPEGKFEQGIIAMTEMSKYRQLMIHPTKGNTKLFESALLTTNLINWDEEYYIAACSKEVAQSLENVKEALGITLAYNNKKLPPVYTHILDNGSELFEKISCPPNTYIGPLKHEHIEIVDKTWTYHGEHTHIFFESLMQNDLTFVLYSNEDKPLAWISINETGALTHLFCLEEHRRKGYGEFIAKYAVNEWLKNGKVPLAFTVEGNLRADRLFRKLGFKRVGIVYWVVTNRVK